MTPKIDVDQPKKPAKGAPWLFESRLGTMERWPVRDGSARPLPGCNISFTNKKNVCAFFWLFSDECIGLGVTAPPLYLPYH